MAQIRYLKLLLILVLYPLGPCAARGAAACGVEEDITITRQSVQCGAFSGSSSGVPPVVPTTAPESTGISSADNSRRADDTGGGDAHGGVNLAAAKKPPPTRKLLPAPLSATVRHKLWVVPRPHDITPFGVQQKELGARRVAHRGRVTRQEKEKSDDECGHVRHQEEEERKKTVAAEGKAATNTAMGEVNETVGKSVNMNDVVRTVTATCTEDTDYENTDHDDPRGTGRRTTFCNDTATNMKGGGLEESKGSTLVAKVG